MALFYIFENLFDARLMRIQVGFYICFCIQSVVIWCLGGSIWRKSSLTQIYSWRRKGYVNSLFRKLWIFLFDTTPKLDK